MKLIKGIAKCLRKASFRSNNVYFKGNTDISLNSKFEGNNVINYGSSIYNSNIGLGTYIGENCYLINCEVGKYCSIASDVKIIVATHPVKDYVSTHPAFFSIKKQSGFTYANREKFEEIKYIDKDGRKSVIIGNDVWIGQGVTILGGVKIGDGAIIGAGSIVTKDVEPYSVSVGVPAEIKKYRTSKENISKLLKFKWWEKDEEWLRKNWESFDNIDKFLEVIEWEK